MASAHIRVDSCALTLRDAVVCGVVVVPQQVRVALVVVTCIYTETSQVYQLKLGLRYEDRLKEHDFCDTRSISLAMLAMLLYFSKLGLRAKQYGVLAALRGEMTGHVRLVVTPRELFHGRVVLDESFACGSVFEYPFEILLPLALPPTGVFGPVDNKLVLSGDVFLAGTRKPVAVPLKPHVLLYTPVSTVEFLPLAHPMVLALQWILNLRPPEVFVEVRFPSKPVLVGDGPRTFLLHVVLGVPATADRHVVFKSFSISLRSKTAVMTVSPERVHCALHTLFKHSGFVVDWSTAQPSADGVHHEVAVDTEYFWPSVDRALRQMAPLYRVSTLRRLYVLRVHSGVKIASEHVERVSDLAYGHEGHFLEALSRVEVVRAEHTSGGPDSPDATLTASTPLLKGLLLFRRLPLLKSGPQFESSLPVYEDEMV